MCYNVCYNTCRYIEERVYFQHMLQQESIYYHMFEQLWKHMLQHMLSILKNKNFYFIGNSLKNYLFPILIDKDLHSSDSILF